MCNITGLSGSQFKDASKAIFAKGVQHQSPLCASIEVCEVWKSIDVGPSVAEQS